MSVTKLITEYKDTITVVFVFLSFLIACTSLYFSVKNNIKDKERLIIKAWNVCGSINDKVYKIDVSITNVGRRIAVLEGLICHYDGGYQSHTHNEDGIVLKEKERITLCIEQRDLIYDVGEGEVYQLEDVSVLDIEGREFKIKNSKTLVSRLLKDF